MSTKTYGIPVLTLLPFFGMKEERGINNQFISNCKKKNIPPECVHNIHFMRGMNLSYKKK